MGFLKTCCGFYCAMTSLVGIYFFLILAIMEFKGNAYLNQIVQNVEEGDEKNPTYRKLDMNSKGLAFLIVMVIQVAFTALCYWCGTSSLKEEAEAEERQREQQLRSYKRIEMQDPNQIVSN